MTAAFLATAGTAILGASAQGMGLAASHGPAMGMHAEGGPMGGPMGGRDGGPMSGGGKGGLMGPMGGHEGQDGMHAGPDGGGYYVDEMMRSDKPADGNDGAARAEANRVFMHSMMAGSLSAADRTYLGSIVAARTGIAQADAEKRVTDSYSQASAAREAAMNDAKQAAETARKAAAHAALWLFIALLVGAFSASFFATIGGHHRDTLFPYVDTPNRV